METINIYLNKEQRKEIDKMKVKYHLSLTTIVDIICEITNDSLFLNADEITTNDFKTRHLYEHTKYKTSISMPKWAEKNKDQLIKPNRFINNSIQAYLKKEIHLYIKKADILNGKHGYWNRINQELTTRTDEWWEYHRFLIMQHRKERNKKNGTNTES